MVVTIGGEEQFCSLMQKQLDNGAGHSVSLANSVIPEGRKGKGKGQKGHFGWNNEKVRSNGLGFRQGI